MLRIGWCVALMPRYYEARLAALAARPNVAVTVLQVAGGMERYPWWNGDTARVPTVTLFPGRSLERLPPAAALVRVLQAARVAEVDVWVANGYSTPWDLALAAFARVTGRLALTVFDSTGIDRPRSPFKERLKGTLLRGLFDGVFCAGTRSRAYLEQLGFPSEAIVEGYDVVDNEHFARPANLVSSVLPRTPFFFAPLRLAPEKNVSRLLEAYRSYAEGARAGGREPWPLVVAGSGPLDGELRRLADGIPEGDVRLPGFLRYEDLPEAYQRAGCVVLPSLSEPWGLVVNEALAAGTPVLVSERCGCVPELVRPGETGFTFDPTRTADLAGLLTLIAALPSAERAEMGHNGRRLIQRFGPEQWADRALELVGRLRHQGHRI